MRVAANEFRFELRGDVVHGERPFVGADLGMEDDVKEEVAELLDERGALAGRHRIEGLVGLFQQRAPEGVVGLLEVPRAAGDGVAQASHRFQEVVEGVGQGGTPPTVSGADYSRAERGRIEAWDGP